MTDQQPPHSMLYLEGVLCDFINCLFAFDDLTDEGHLKKDGEGTRKASDVFMEALRYPEIPQTGFKVGETIRK